MSRSRTSDELKITAVLVGLLLALALVAGACAGDDEGDIINGDGNEIDGANGDTVGGGNGDAVGGATVEMENTAFQPAEITVSVEDTVEWVNNDSFAHTVTAADGSFDSGNVGGGESFSHTFTEAGEYPYECTIHPGMEGTVIVE